MRKGFLASLTALLAGTSLALADPPATSDPAAVAAPNGAGQPAGVGVPPGPGGPIWDGPRSPYWPDPVGKTQCAAPSCIVPQAPHEPPERLGQFFVWGSAEYLLWWVKNQPLSTPLVTTAPPGTTAPGAPPLGALTAPGTAVIFGGSDIDYHTFSGGRFTLGFGFGQSCDDLWGVEASGFFTERRPSDMFATSSVTGVPLLARPVILTNPPVTPSALNPSNESVIIISEPGVTSGNVTVASDSAFYGWDVNLIHSAYRGGPLHIDLLGGFRYLNLSEDLDITQNSMPVTGTTVVVGGNTSIATPNAVVVFDHFGTRNEFYGGQLGARAQYAGERFFVSGLFKIGLGNSHEVVDLAGLTRSGGVNTAGGLLVLSSNMGRRAHDEFAAVPEIGINVGYQINHWTRVFVGYTFLYWSEVVRPGEQINRTVNPNLLPISPSFRGATTAATAGPAEPSFSFQRTDFWAQGVNFGLEFRF